MMLLSGAAMAAMALALVTGLLGSLLAEALLRPQPRPFWQRRLAANAVHLGSWLLLFGVFTLLLQRPWFAVVFILSLQLVVVQSSNTKSATLNEPFICHDFEYFWDAILHPRLYVPFFGIGLAIAASSAGAVAIGSFFYFEPSLVGQWGLMPWLFSCLLLILAGALLLAASLKRLPPPTLAPTHDLHETGLYTSLWSYGVALMRSRAPGPERSPFQPFSQPLGEPQCPPDATTVAPTSKGNTLPNVILVQSESFFDPRPWCQDVAPGLLSQFDATAAEALEQGELHVPAWGANTVRTECAVLTGLTPSDWGPRQFNPYRTLSRHPLASVASAFKAQGYRTVCVHPYPATFYLRDKVIPLLGFDTFIDLSAFETQEKHGQYIGDQAVARKVGRLLKDDDNRPLFVFVITMENHGPLHLEAPQQQRLAETLPNAPWPLPNHLRDLAVYLHHLGEADRMLGGLKTALTEAQRPGLLGWYGDHVPILPAAYGYFGAPTGRTPYMIWSTQRQPSDPPPAEHMPQGIAANELGVRLFKQVFGRDISSDVIKAEPEPQEQE
ncbi:LTA synthase family protein [Vreelandella hamiltonii]|uniref:Capsular polysaccharide biosynthesis protein n=1 Tax=Vreelandella hamiltonii TaxID=502829 RepID=A0A8H9I4T3_9GAMM|nr:LTA synthase family protein [Halomonas hamiltonii]GGW38250.1 capsular polysaccharide biosynthesis protein [Halomonas hamiltonii]